MSHEGNLSTKPYLWNKVRCRGCLPDPACCHSLVTYRDRYLILFGGGSGEGSSSAVHVYDLDIDAWMLVETGNSEIVSPRVSHSAVIYKDKMIIYGGQVLEDLMLFDDVLELDLITWTWRHVHNAPSEPEGPGERRLHTAHVYNDRMYVLMGEPCHTRTTFWYLDLVDYSWHRVQSDGADNVNIPPPPLIGHSAVVEGDTLYVFGGYATEGSTSVYSNISYKNTLHQYHFPTNRWVQVSAHVGPSPWPRYCCAMAVYEARVYVFGGDFDGSTFYFNDFWTIDTSVPKPARWEEIPPTRVNARGGHVDYSRPSARSGHAYTTARLAFYIVGGEAPGVYDAGPQYLNDLYRYPLGLSSYLSLMENTARWISTVPAGGPLADMLPRLPLHLQRRIRSYIPDRRWEEPCTTWSSLSCEARIREESSPPAFVTWDQGSWRLPHSEAFTRR